MEFLFIYCGVDNASNSDLFKRLLTIHKDRITSFDLAKLFEN